PHRARTRPPAESEDRLRLPEFPTDAAADGARKRGRAVALRRRVRVGAEATGTGGAGDGRPRGPTRSSAESTFGRAATAGGHRPGARQPGGAPSRGRADG